MHSAGYAVARCLSVRPSVCLSVKCRYSVETAQNIIKLFSRQGSHIILAFAVGTYIIWQYSDRDPLTGASNARGMKKSRFSTNISLYLGNDARWSHSYYGRFIGNCTQAFEWYRLE